MLDHKKKQEIYQLLRETSTQDQVMKNSNMCIKHYDRIEISQSLKQKKKSSRQEIRREEER